MLYGGRSFWVPLLVELPSMKWLHAVIWSGNAYHTRRGHILAENLVIFCDNSDIATSHFCALKVV